MGEAAVDRRAQVPFRSAKQALYWAHEVEATDLTRVSKAISSMAGGSVSTAKERLSPEEQHAQAAYVILAMNHRLTREEMDLIRANYLARGSAERRERIERVAFRVSEAMDRPGMLLDWVIETAATWFGDRPYEMKRNKHGILVPLTARDWSRRAGVPETTLSGWKNGGKREDGVYPLLWSWFGDAEGSAVVALKEADLVP